MEDDVQASSLPEVNSRQLRAVLAVAEYRSFIAAAAFLKTSQPALTRTIKQIEGALGASLFSRSTRQVSVTEAGKEFAALAERLLNDLKIGIENVRELAEQQRGQIIVASIMSLAHVALPRLIAEYNRHFPGIEIHLRGVFTATSKIASVSSLQSSVRLRAPWSARSKGWSKAG
jgi:DNA-binding transcriptional LysR family regulator